MSAAPSNRGTKVGAKLASPNPQVQPNFVDYETLLLPPLGRASPAILDHPDHPGHPPSRAHSCQTKDRGSSFILSGPTLAVVVLSFVTGLSFKWIVMLLLTGLVDQTDRSEDIEPPRRGPFAPTSYPVDLLQHAS
ncbi:hypothetical protein PtA15_6A879 [Puccinia triticina]|uniref:Uncharacterized protein n=1 Tax=Puccinia triticina TaxID=208348 RepID=A0ABY7CU57_9BASI|nr:uncharacterized protein PtA15_6A879 [Puccinia triticina]WAQ86247.1 hypothetical protein PtA15_6A879 [Puccinia triticina]